MLSVEPGDPAWEDLGQGSLPVSTVMLDRPGQVGKGSGTSLSMLLLCFEMERDGGSEAGCNLVFFPAPYSEKPGNRKQPCAPLLAKVEFLEESSSPSHDRHTLQFIQAGEQRRK